MNLRLILEFTGVKFKIEDYVDMSLEHDKIKKIAEEEMGGSDSDISEDLDKELAEDGETMKPVEEKREELEPMEMEKPR